MPHYKDWYGTRFQDPADGGESWGTFEPEIDLTQAATKIDWRKTQSNSFPGFDEQNLNTAYWDNNNLPRPEAIAPDLVSATSGTVYRVNIKKAHY